MRTLLVIVIGLLLACGGPSARTTQVVASAPRCLVTDFGAVADDGGDDRPAFQSALDACCNRELFIPAGTYDFSGVPLGYRSINVRCGVRMRGASVTTTVLRQLPGVSGAVRLIELSGEGVTVESLALDGNKVNQTVNEHRHGIFVRAASNTVIRDVEARNFTGDGFYVYTPVSATLFDRVAAHDNGRNGLTLGATSSDTTVLNSSFSRNAAQQFDSEPGYPNVVSKVRIYNSTLDGGGVTNGYVLTVSGTGRAHTPGSDWIIANNTINGPIFVVWAENVVITGNRGHNWTTRPCITVSRRSRAVMYVGNECTMTQTTHPNLAGIYAFGTSAGDTPEVTIAGNVLTLTGAHPNMHGVMVTGAHRARIVNNVLNGPAGGPSTNQTAGIYLRATIIEEDWVYAIVSGNSVMNFGRYGLGVFGNGAARLLTLEVLSNRFTDNAERPAMTTAVTLNPDGLNAAKRIVARDNQLNGVTVRYATVPAYAEVE